MPDDLTPVVIPCGAALIRFWGATDFLETVMPGVPALGSAPNYRPQDFALAAQLGYGTGMAAVRAMWRDHDPLHTWVSVQSGHRYSPTLWYAARDKRPPKGLAPAEEQQVFALQTALNGRPPNPDACAALLAATARDLPTLVAQAQAFLAQLERTTP